MGKSSVKESMWIYFIDFSENLFGFQFFYYLCCYKENGNPPLTSSTLIGGGLFAFIPLRRGMI